MKNNDKGPLFWLRVIQVCLVLLGILMVILILSEVL